jgi:O-antigen ligase
MSESRFMNRSAVEPAPADTGALKKQKRKRQQAKGAYLALLALSGLYFGRPEDVIPGIGVIPMAKIAGGLALIGLLLSLMSGKAKQKFAPETKYVICLFLWFCITIPFAYWRAGAFVTVMERLSKSVIVAVLVALVVKEFWQLKRLVWMQAAAVAMMTLVSVGLHRTHGGRLIGALGGVFENPNDLAINIALNWPICVAFFFISKGISRVFWAVAVLAMLVGVELTYSRSGFLAAGLAAVLVLWEYAIRGRRHYLLAVAAALLVVLAIAMPSHYRARLTSIVTGNEVDSMDNGSAAARKELLMESIKTAIHNPIFGVGAGNFEVTAGSWHVAHNSYTEIAAEGGIPALIFFSLMLYRTLRNIKMTRRTQMYAADPEVRGLTGGLWVSVASYMVSAFFASTEYSMYPYFLVAYTTALYTIVAGQEQAIPMDATDSKMGSRKKYGRETRELVWSR